MRWCLYTVCQLSILISIYENEILTGSALSALCESDRPSVRLWPFSENAHKSWTTWYILTNACQHYQHYLTTGMCECLFMGEVLLSIISAG